VLPPRSGEAASEHWRALLRSRPSGVSAGSAAAYSQAQWRWISSRILTCYKQAGKPEESIVVYRRLIKSEPQNVDLRMELVHALLSLDRTQAAYNELRRIREIDPHHLGATLELAERARQRFEYDEALRLLRDLYRAKPDDPQVTAALVSMLRSQGEHIHSWGRHLDALALFDEGQQLAPGDPFFVIAGARVDFDRGRPAQARRRLQQAEVLAAGKPEGAIIAPPRLGLCRP
jgi:tetratricopeptide (TPR) repeat protein